ncbi:hypothetical protein [Spirosoma daeguense]
MKSALILASILIILSVIGYKLFSGWGTFYETDYKGKHFVLQEKETKGFSTNSFQWRFKLGKHPYVYINALTRDWGQPYSTDVYGTNPYSYIKEINTTYVSAYESSDSVDRTVYTFLYIDPDEVSEAAYKDYLDFMKNAWQLIDSAYAGDDLRGFPRIMGLVYGKQEKFILEFKGKLRFLDQPPAPYICLIRPDGRVDMVNDDGVENVVFSGLSSQVQMPGKILYYQKSDFKLTELKQLKTQNGRSLEHYFTIIEQE